MASKFRPRLFGNQPMMMDPLHIALYYAHKHSLDADRGADRAPRPRGTESKGSSLLAPLGEGGNTSEAECLGSPKGSGFELPTLSVPAAAQAVADDAARRVARNTTGDTKRTALAMGVDLLGGVK